MTKKVLFSATVDKHIIAFHLPYLKWFKDRGWEVHVAAKGDLPLSFADKKYNLPFERTPVSFKNLKAYKELKRIIDNNHFEIIHCHTPVGGVLTRLAAHQARKSGTKLIYTAHGFHFYKGAPAINWMVYYPLEWLLATQTDCLITINEEDFRIATGHKFKARQIEHVHGVGVDTKRFSPISNEKRDHLRRKHGYKSNQFILLYAAELNKNKNQYLLIKSVAHLKKQIPDIKLLLVGCGLLQEEYARFAAENGVLPEIDFLGYREDIEELLNICDVAVASSHREGLPVNVIEAMACGLPLVASSNRGHRELVTNGVNGYIVEDNDDVLFSESIYAMYKSNSLREVMGRKSMANAKRYKLTQVVGEMSKIYQRYM